MDGFRVVPVYKGSGGLKKMFSTALANSLSSLKWGLSGGIPSGGLVLVKDNLNDRESMLPMAQRLLSGGASLLAVPVDMVTVDDKGGRVFVPLALNMDKWYENDGDSAPLLYAGAEGVSISGCEIAEGRGVHVDVVSGAEFVDEFSRGASWKMRRGDREYTAHKSKSGSWCVFDGPVAEGAGIRSVSTRFCGASVSRKMTYNDVVMRVMWGTGGEVVQPIEIEGASDLKKLRSLRVDAEELAAREAFMRAVIGDAFSRV